MSLRRPSWNRTNVPWEQKVQAWESMAHGATDSKVVTEFEAKGLSLDRKTAKQLRSELKDLPSEMVDDLSDAIRPYWANLTGKVVASLGKPIVGVTGVSSQATPAPSEKWVTEAHDDLRITLRGLLTRTTGPDNKHTEWHLLITLTNHKSSPTSIVETHLIIERPGGWSDEILGLLGDENIGSFDWPGYKQLPAHPYLKPQETISGEVVFYDFEPMEANNGAKLIILDATGQRHSLEVGPQWRVDMKGSERFLVLRDRQATADNVAFSLPPLGDAGALETTQPSTPDKLTLHVVSYETPVSKDQFGDYHLHLVTTVEVTASQYVRAAKCVLVMGGSPLSEYRGMPNKGELLGTATWNPTFPVPKSIQPGTYMVCLGVLLAQAHSVDLLEGTRDTYVKSNEFEVSIPELPPPDATLKAALKAAVPPQRFNSGVGI